LSRECFDEKALFEGLRNVLEHAPVAVSQLTSAQRAILGNVIASVDGKLSCERILDEIEARRDILAPRPWANEWTWLQAWARLKRRALARTVRTRIKSHRSSKVYTAHKFPGIDITEVSDRIVRLRRTLGRFDGLQARQLMPNVFTIEHS